MTRTVTKGHHRFSGWFPPRVYVGDPPSVRWDVKFDRSCTVIEPGPDSRDWNKCVGLSFGLHTREAARFGWRGTGSGVEVCAYLTEGGANNGLQATAYPIDVDARHMMELRPRMRVNSIDCSLFLDGVLIGVSVHPNAGWGYRLNPYFGGNLPAPVDMSIDVSTF